MGIQVEDLKVGERYLDRDIGEVEVIFIGEELIVYKFKMDKRIVEEASYIDRIICAWSKPTKPFERWINIYPYGEDSVVYPTKQEADANALAGRINRVKLTGSYEAEE